MIAPILTTAAFLLAVWGVLKLITTPIRWTVKLLINSIWGLALLVIFNVCCSPAGISLPLTLFNACVAGVGGVGGILLLLLV